MNREQPSGQRFDDYQAKALERRKAGKVTDNRGAVKKPRQRSFTELFVRFWAMLGTHRPMVVGSLVALSLATLMSLVPLYAPKIVVDYILGDQPMPQWIRDVIPGAGSPKSLLISLVVISVVITAVSVGLGLWARWQNTRVTKRMHVEVRRVLFDQASRLPLHRIIDLKSGGVASLLRDDAAATGDLVFSMIYNPWRAVTQLAGSLVILAWIYWKLLTGGLMVLPLVWFTHRTWIARIRPMWKDIRRTRRDVDAASTEVFGGMRIVRGFNRQRTESTAFMKRNNFMARQELMSWWWMRGVDTAWALLIPVASAALLLYGSIRILDERALVAAGQMAPQDALTIGDLFVFLGYLAALLGPIASLAGTATGLQNALAAMDRVLDILDEPREFDPPANPVLIDPDTVRGQVTLDRVGFAYPKSTKHVLEDVSLVAEPGTTVALVGPSGAGKTTLCNLVARFYDPTAGRVLLDGIDIRDIPVHSYRALLGIVEQDVFLFDGTVSQNIAYGTREATQAQIEQAARQANAHSFIVDLESGYDTMIGERGVKLSGGQRQRLAIARALLSDPRLLILDEATSNLDTESERLIQASLKTLMRGRTSFVIAHRLSTIQHADQILVLNHGGILERGTHDELMAAGGTYRGMIEMQLAPASEPAPA